LSRPDGPAQRNSPEPRQGIPDSSDMGKDHDWFKGFSRRQRQKIQEAGRKSTVPSAASGSFPPPRGDAVGLGDACARHAKYGIRDTGAVRRRKAGAAPSRRGRV